jgi:hypothetical protein
VSGLLTALNQFVVTEFDAPIDSINMGGLSWIYDYDEEHNILYVAADKKDSEINTMASRLEFVKRMFIQQFIETEVIYSWDGNMKFFRPFKALVDEIYKSWQTVEDKVAFLELFDYIRIFQQFSDLVYTIIKGQLDPNKRGLMQAKLDEFFLEFKEREDLIDKIELDKFSYANDTGFKFFGVNPENCEIYILKRELKGLLAAEILAIREVMGDPIALYYFKDYGIFKYIMENLAILNKFEITDYFLLLLVSD